MTALVKSTGHLGEAEDRGAKSQGRLVNFEDPREWGGGAQGRRETPTILLAQSLDWTDLGAA